MKSHKILIMLSILFSHCIMASEVDEQTIINEALSDYKKGNTELALKKIQPLLGTSPKAMYNLAVIYSFGKTPILKPESQKLRAFQLFEKAALHGYAPAMYMLATRYKLGIGTAKDSSKAIEWLKMAADKSHTEACYDLATVYYKGLDDMPVDHASAMKYLKLAARHHHVKAQSLIGYMYAVGEGTTAEKEKALQWLELAANKGDEVAQKNIELLTNLNQDTASIETDAYWSLR